MYEDLMNENLISCRKYTLQHIAHVEENKEELGGKRYFVELDLESEGKAYRFSDYFLKPRLNESLCLPEGHNGWRHDVMVCPSTNSHLPKRPSNCK